MSLMWRHWLHTCPACHRTTAHVFPYGTPWLECACGRAWHRVPELVYTFRPDAYTRRHQIKVVVDADGGAHLWGNDVADDPFGAVSA